MSRTEFQRKYVALAPQDPIEPAILNVGSCNDPMGFGLVAMHVDIDDWSKVCVHFTQSNAEHMPFPDKSYHTVILGDILEHVVRPNRVIEEAARVCSDTFVMTVFEEWRLPGPGQWIKEGQAEGDKTTFKMGYADREDYQRQVFPERIGVDDNETPHLIHINQFTDLDAKGWADLIQSLGFEPLEVLKEWEVQHEGHDIYNWLYAFKRRV